MLDPVKDQLSNPFNLPLTLCLHLYDAVDDIHDIRLPPTREAVNELLLIFEILNQRQPPSTRNRLLLTTEGRVMPPLGKLFQRALEFKRLYPDQAPYRMALMVNQRTIFMNLVEAFFRMLRTSDVVQSFEEESHALAWLSMQ